MKIDCERSEFRIERRMISGMLTKKRWRGVASQARDKAVRSD